MNTSTKTTKTTPITLATTDGANVYTSAGETIPLRTVPTTAAALAEGAARHGIAQLWLCGYPSPALDFGERTDTRGAWDFRPSDRAGDAWAHGIKKGTDHVLDIVTPHLDTSSPWHDAPDAKTLINSLTLYQRHMGIAFRHSGGTTAAALLRELHSGGRGAIPLDVIGEFPLPALDGGTEAPIMWARALTPREQQMRYLHAYDKNGAFLAACSSLALGAGAAEHVDAPAFDDLTLPGYFLVRVDEGDCHIPAFTRRKRAADAMWVTAPTLLFLRARGVPVDVREAWVWREHHRPLEPWYARVRDARASMMKMQADGIRGAALALAAVKDTYSVFTGGYLASMKLRDSEHAADLYRPDIRHHIIATARCNLLRKVDRVHAESGISPVAVGGVDTVFYVSDTPDPVAACPAPFTIGTTLRDVKVKSEWCVPLADVRDVLTGPANPRDRWNALAQRINVHVLASARANGNAGGKAVSA